MARYIALLVFAVLAGLLATPVASYASITPVPVPEPTTLALLGVGAGAVGVVAWVRARRKK
jgi:hypothetical protein